MTVQNTGNAQLYVREIPTALNGKDFRAARASVQGGIAMGIYRSDGTLEMGPSDATQLRQGDSLVVLSKRRNFNFQAERTTRSHTAQKELSPPRLSSSGHRPKLISVVDNGSPACDEVIERIRSFAPKRTRIRVVRNTGKQLTREMLRSVRAEKADSVVVLGPGTPDRDLIPTTLLLRDQRPLPVHVAAETTDGSAAELVGRAFRPGVDTLDVLRPNQLGAGMLAKAASSPAAHKALSELLVQRGMEVHLEPVKDIAPEACGGSGASFNALAEHCRQHGYLLLGSLPAKTGEPDLAPTTELDSPKVWSLDDSLVLLSDAL